MEWIILDDGDDCVRDVFEKLAADIPNLRYIRKEGKQLIGAKRNILNTEARGDILVAMDDDDYYSPDRVSHVVTKFASNPKIELAGSSELYIYFTDIKTIYRLGPYGPNHATNGTMAWRRSYAMTHKYDETVTHAEERSFLDGYVNPMIQLDPFKVMLVMSHSQNTFDKKKLLEHPSPLVNKTGMKMDAFIRNSKLREFFKTA